MKSNKDLKKIKTQTADKQPESLIQPSVRD